METTWEQLTGLGKSLARAVSVLDRQGVDHYHKVAEARTRFQAGRRMAGNQPRLP